MNFLDRELKNALRREEPPADFAARVLASVQSSAAPKPNWRAMIGNALRLPALRWAAPAAIFLALVIGLAAYRRYQQIRIEAALARKAEGEMARAQVMIALRIASSKLNVVMREVRQRDLRPRVRAVPKI